MTDQQAPQEARRLRSDTRRNRRRLLEAVGEIAREAPDQLTMKDVANRAEIGPATAYRYYSTLDDVVAAYVLGVVDELRDFSVSSGAEGRPLFDGVVDRWLDLLAEHGPVMVQLRSRRGFLERLHDGNETILAVREAWSRPVQGLLADLGLPAQVLEHALFLHNMMYDPREIHDLLQETGMSRREVTARLTEAYLGALRGWARAG
ncbi:TetR family transcriptional regulator [Pseudonocardia sp. CNS-004]|nr:TetR family transcriptional regulator [Pseudonocardia sp. CNS-004]